jgi:hypothetical protein
VNAEQYVRKNAAAWSNWRELENGNWVAKDSHYEFLQGREFMPEEVDEIEEGLLFQAEILEVANTLENNLIRNGRTYFKGYDIRIENYQGSVFFEEVTCQITYTHKVTENCLHLCEVYFRDEDGEIGQAVMEF